MSTTAVVERGSRWFWAFDSSLGIWLKHLIDLTLTGSDEQKAEFAADVDDWRRCAVLGGMGGATLTVAEDWADSKLLAFVSLAKRTCETIATHGAFTSEEADTWDILDHRTVRPFGVLPGACIVELGDAVIALAEGTLEADPAGGVWVYGYEDGRAVQRMNTAD